MSFHDVIHYVLFLLKTAPRWLLSPCWKIRCIIYRNHTFNTVALICVFTICLIVHVSPQYWFYVIVRRSIECVSFVWNYIIIMKVRLAWAIRLFISIIISCLRWLSATARIHPSFLQCRLGSVSLRNVSSSSWCGSGRMWLRRTYNFCFPGVTV